MEIIIKDENNITVDGQELVAHKVDFMRDCKKCDLYDYCIDSYWPPVKCYWRNRADNENVIFIKK